MAKHDPPPTQVIAGDSSDRESPFDGAARDYDLDFSHTPLGRELRAGVWRELENVFLRGDRVLELGCGTGEDALWLARRGVRVRATDASQAMLDVAREKVEAAGEGSMVETARIDLSRLEDVDWTGEGPFDGVLANFGVLNCIEDREPVARVLADLVRPGGRVAAVVMGPCCPWEVIWHLAHLEPRAALRRLRQGQTVHVGGGVSIPVWYPSPARIRREFTGRFEPTKLVAIGCFLPPPYLAHLWETRPALIRRMVGLESRWRGTFPFTWCGDHYLQLFER